MNKVFYFDTETTGLDFIKTDIIQLGYIIELDNEIAEKGIIYCQPFNYATIEKGALEVNKTTLEMLKGYQSPEKAYEDIIRILNRYVDKYNKKDKFIPAGYNVNFDIQMLKSFFMKNNNKYFGAYFNYHALDPISLLYMLEFKKILKLENYKLTTACEYFRIKLEAHNALNDIEATRELIKKLLEYVKE